MMPGRRCSKCDALQKATTQKTFVAAGKQEDDVWTTVAICPGCAETA